MYPPFPKIKVKEEAEEEAVADIMEDMVEVATVAAEEVVDVAVVEVEEEVEDLKSPTVITPLMNTLIP
jgi:hypothetical protein